LLAEALVCQFKSDLRQGRIERETRKCLNQISEIDWRLGWQDELCRDADGA
jgi:hypothetical protein